MCLSIEINVFYGILNVIIGIDWRGIMIVDKQYFQSKTILKTLLSAGTTKDNTLSCGFLHKENSNCIERDVIFGYYGGLYVISGSGEYIDAKTGKSTPVYPGCVLQRMPEIHHHTLVKNDGKWLEFHFCAGAPVFEMLVTMGMVTNNPVFYVGEDPQLLRLFIDYMERFQYTNEEDNGELVIEFQKLLFALNTRKQNDHTDSQMKLICEKLRESYHIGISIPDIAKELNMGYESMRKKFKETFGCSISQYRLSLRINAGKTLLVNHKLSVKEVAHELGYYDEYAFSKQFKSHVGLTPHRPLCDR